MYGFGGVGQVEVRFGQVSPWRDKQTTEQGKIANGLWNAEMSNIDYILFALNPHCKTQMLGISFLTVLTPFF